VTETQRKSGWLNRSRRIVKYYYLKVMRNSGSPEYIARGAALGIFIGFAIPIGFQIAAAGPPALHIATTASAARVRKAGTSGCRAMSNFMSGAFSPDKISEKSRNNP